jgi:hypothetical protein
MKNIAPGLLVMVFALTSFAAEGKNVSYKSGGETVQGILYPPPGKGPFPAIGYSRDFRRKGSGHPAGVGKKVCGNFEAAWQKGRDQDVSRCRPWLRKS